MALFRQEGRVAWIEGPGELFVVSDLHGNLRDFLRIAEIFEQHEGACLLFLGDLFHGPYLTQQDWAPYTDVLGDFYYDQSPGLFRGYLELKRRYPGRVKAILGNHEHSHVGGPRVSKFTPDEAFSFEENLSLEERRALVRDLSAWPWMVGSRCGVSFTHGAPPPTHFNKQSLNAEKLYVTNPQEWVQSDVVVLSELLWRRYSPPEDVEVFLDHISSLCETKQHVVVHGHEPTPAGYQVEHTRLFNLSSSFAMRRPDKTYLRLSLDESYLNAYEVEACICPLYDGIELDPLINLAPLPFEDNDDTLDEST